MACCMCPAFGPLLRNGRSSRLCSCAHTHCHATTGGHCINHTRYPYLCAYALSSRGHAVAHCCSHRNFSTHRHPDPIPHQHAKACRYQNSIPNQHATARCYQNSISHQHAAAHPHPDCAPSRRYAACADPDPCAACIHTLLLPCTPTWPDVRHTGRVLGWNGMVGAGSLRRWPARGRIGYRLPGWWRVLVLFTRQFPVGRRC